jgi:hypothetical protein
VREIILRKGQTDYASSHSVEKPEYAFEDELRFRTLRVWRPDQRELSAAFVECTE